MARVQVDKVETLCESIAETLQGSPVLEGVNAAHAVCALLLLAARLSQFGERTDGASVTDARAREEFKNIADASFAEALCINGLCDHPKTNGAIH
jgi:hypothetical protein